MKTKVRNKKTKCSKVDIEPHEMSHANKVASCVGCSRRMVNYVLTENRNIETELGQRILIADAVLREEESNLLKEVKRIVKF